MLEIRPIDLNDKKSKEAFIKFPWKIYAGDKYWVPPLLMDMRAKLDLKNHPFFEFGQIQAFMAYKNGAEVGRIAAINNTRYNEFHKSNIGFWGFFECVNDQQVATALFDATKNWLKTKGFESMEGPVSPSTNYDAGLLVEGFDDSPRVMMTYNPEYYVKLVDNYGHKKAMGLLAYKLEKDKILGNEKLNRVAQVAKERSKITLRYIDTKNLKGEAAIIKNIYNRAWESNWGFVPMSDGELDAMVKELKMVVKAKLFPILENEKGEAVGLAFTLPDYNELIKGFNGKLFPFNFLKLLTQQKKIRWLRVILLGILPEYRNKGLDAILYQDLISNGMAMGNDVSEASWILENNPGMNRGLEMLNAYVYKRYNIYSFPID